MSAGTGQREADEASEGVRRKRQEDSAEDRHDLERDGVGRDQREGADKDRREREVEDVEREPAEPLRVPARQLAVREQVVDEVVDGYDVARGVPPDVHVRTEDQPRLELGDDERGDAGDDDEGRERGRVGQHPQAGGEARRDA